jgi:hypothetical protein
MEFGWLLTHTHSTGMLRIIWLIRNECIFETVADINMRREEKRRESGAVVRHTRLGGTRNYI